MAADITELTAQYRLLAEINTSSSLSAQKTWLTTQFSSEFTGGTSEVTSLTQEGSSSAFQWRGSTSEERRAALRRAIEDITAEIAGDVIGPSAPCMLIPLFVPRAGL